MTRSRTLVVFVGVALALTTLPRAQQAIFSSHTESVRVDVLVTDGGKPVLGLQPGNFEISDNGIPQRAEFVTFEQVPLNVSLALDLSASLSAPRLADLQKAGRSVVDALQPRDTASLVTFNGVVTIATSPTGDAARVRTALDVPVHSGDTALYDASYAALALAQSDTARGLVIVFSDGSDTASFLRPDAVVATAKRADAVVYAVSDLIGTTTFLSDLCEFTGGRVLPSRFTNLDRTFLTIFDEFRQRYLVSYTPSGVSKPGWHKLEVKVKGRKATVKARPGYLIG